LISTEIDFEAPEDLASVLAILADEGDDVTILSGGMSLLPMMNLGLASPDRVVSLRRVASLRQIEDDGEAVVVGGMVPHVVVATEPAIQAAAPAVATAASLIGDVQVRNRGTIGGSVSHADPAADYVASLCAHRAQIVLDSARTGRRLVAASEFLIDAMLTDRQPEELVTGVRIPKMAAGAVSEYIRFARVEGSFAIASAATVLASGGKSMIAVGGVGPGPVVFDISAHEGAGWGNEAAEAVANAVFDACDNVQGDIASDADYRREMARVHARRVVRRATARLNNVQLEGGDA
jgi:carbon-monoxide dehydrogenase medium subunit